MSNSDEQRLSVQRLNFVIEQESRVLYAKFLGPTLAERCAELGSETRCTLDDEVKIVQMLAKDAFDQYEAAVKLAVEAKASEFQLAKIRIESAQFIYAAMQQVRDMVLARRRVISEGALDPHQVQTVILQVVQQFDNRIQQLAPILRANGIDPTEYANEFEQAIRSVQLPLINQGASHEPGGYDPDYIDPDDEAAAMDATVPACPESSHETNGYHNGAA